MKIYGRLKKKGASFRCISPALLAVTTWKRTSYNQAVNKTGFPTAALKCTAVTGLDPQRGILRVWKKKQNPNAHPSTFPAWERYQGQEGNSSIREFRNQRIKKEWKELCFHNNRNACAYISKSLLTSADLSLSWSVLGLVQGAHWDPFPDSPQQKQGLGRPEKGLLRCVPFLPQPLLISERWHICYGK